MRTRYKDTHRWCRGKVGVEHAAVSVRRPPEPPCHRRDNWRELLANDDPNDHYRYYNAPWECRHDVVCDACGKVLDDWPAWDRCPDLDATPDGRELHKALLELRDE